MHMYVCIYIYIYIHIYIYTYIYIWGVFPYNSDEWNTWCYIRQKGCMNKILLETEPICRWFWFSPLCCLMPACQLACARIPMLSVTWVYILVCKRIFIPTSFQKWHFSPSWRHCFSAPTVPFLPQLFSILHLFDPFTSQFLFFLSPSFLFISFYFPFLPLSFKFFFFVPVFRFLFHFLYFFPQNQINFYPPPPPVWYFQYTDLCSIITPIREFVG